jgi:hypothetical protein
MRQGSGAKTTTRSTKGGHSGKKIRRPQGHDDMIVPIMGLVTWNDPQRKPTPILLDVNYDPETETGHICLNVKLRQIQAIELRPARRPLLDASGKVDPGHVEDAMRLANTEDRP